MNKTQVKKCMMDGADVAVYASDHLPKDVFRFESTMDRVLRCRVISKDSP